MVLTAMEALVTDVNAKHFTAILDKILKHIDGFCCRVMVSWEDEAPYVFKQHEAALSAAKELEPYCSEDDTNNQLMIKQTIALAMSHIRDHGPEAEDTERAKQRDEEIKGMEKEALELFRQAD